MITTPPTGPKFILAVLAEIRARSSAVKAKKQRIEDLDPPDEVYFRSLN